MYLSKKENSEELLEWKEEIVHGVKVMTVPGFKEALEKYQNQEEEPKTG